MGQAGDRHSVVSFTWGQKEASLTVTARPPTLLRVLKGPYLGCVCVAVNSVVVDICLLFVAVSKPSCPELASTPRSQVFSLGEMINQAKGSGYGQGRPTGFSA